MVGILAKGSSAPPKRYQRAVPVHGPNVRAHNCNGDFQTMLMIVRITGQRILSRRPGSCRVPPAVWSLYEHGVIFDDKKVLVPPSK